MHDARTKHGPTFWVIVALIVMLLYPLSFGPACWISERTEDDGKILSFVYGPIIRIAFENPTIGGFALKYACWGLRRYAVPVLHSQDNTKITKISWRTFSLWRQREAKNQPNPFMERPIEPPNGAGFGGGMGVPR
jgi:hypothetical protein